ncbi:hemagglutinin/hemolysin-like protein [Microseira wollei NIES-4236]|uniref:Hemagglutinin/hemolysin-like protein n=2 Tax=Microseira wollei TaxID=467598 RepID=A0AAV3XB46_9CYAN|nr:hemagglutinin/hemolysin-like protein [Microseira wollei NIES-4236]
MSVMKKLSMAAIGAMLFTMETGIPAQAQSNIKQPIHYNSVNRHKYFFIDPAANGPFLSNWHRTQYAANRSSGNLVTINDAAEQNWLVKNFGGKELFWIGLSDFAKEGDFRWVNNGQRPQYTNWWPGEPNNAYYNEDFVVMNWAAPGKWNDVLGIGTNPGGFNSDSIRGIVEFEGLTVPTNGSKASLLFQEVGGVLLPGWDHVGLYFNGYVYESTKPTTEGLYWNPESRKYEPVDNVNGVQKERSRGVFRAFPSSNTLEIPISYDLANKMADKINSKVRSAGYQYLTLPGMLQGNFLPFKQKGWLDNNFTCVGLIEWAAESVGHRGGQGFIPWYQEFIYIPYLNVSIPTLTPQIMYWAVISPNSFSNPGNYLHSLLDPVDFILTDSLGRRFGYTAELGLVNEIPDAFYSGDGWAEQFYIPNLPSGDYKLDLFGLDDEANIAIGNSTIGTLFSGFLAKGETRTLTFHLPELELEPKSVPESSSELGVFAIGALGISLRLKRQQKTI